MRRPKSLKVSIIVPVYNEEKTVLPAITRVFRARLPRGFTKEVIVVNDGSADKTAAILSRTSFPTTTISHSKNTGKGSAILTGLTASSGDIVLIQDADLEYDPSYFPLLLTPFLNSRIKAVFGSRLINYPLRLTGSNPTPMPTHWLANHFLSFVTRLLYGQAITDMETGYKAIDRKLFLSLNLKSKKFDIEPEITAKVLKRGVKIIEVPIRVQPRSYAQGKKIGLTDGLAAIWALFKYRLVD